MKRVFTQIPGFCDEGLHTQFPHLDGFVSCDVFVGYRAVYRVSFAMAVFFFLLSLLMIEVKTSSDPRASIHNGYVSASCCPSSCFPPSSLSAEHRGESFMQARTASGFLWAQYRVVL